MALGGMVLEPAAEERRTTLKIPAGQLALRVKHVGQYGEHAKAKQAGLLKEDIVIEFDGDAKLRSESEIIATTMNGKRPGDKVTVGVLRDGKKLSFVVPVQ